MSGFARALERSWYRAGGAWPWLRPLAAIYGVVIAFRRLAYRRGWFRVTRVDVPVLVVGNISVGGSGKTPLVLSLVARLQSRGHRVGVVSRGYGGRAARYPLMVTADTATAQAGDESVLIAQRSAAPVAVDPVRVRAAAQLVNEASVDCLIADDGLQHYALARDAEVAVVDARRGYGNGRLLPAGPLREPRTRLASVDLVLRNGKDGDFWLAPGDAVSLHDARRRPLSDFRATPVHVVAGIGDPSRFFDMLRGLGLAITAHPMPDHHVFTATDIDFGDDAPVLMTEKDAVKCRTFACVKHWAVPVEARFSSDAESRMAALLDRFCALSRENSRRIS